MTQRIVRVSKIHDHSYFRRQEQAIPEESTVRTSGSGDSPLDKPVAHCAELQKDLTADVIEFTLNLIKPYTEKTKYWDKKKRGQISLSGRCVETKAWQANATDSERKLSHYPRRVLAQRPKPEEASL